MHSDRVRVSGGLSSFACVALFSFLIPSFVQVHLRAEDGRGPLWWAHEYEKWDIIDLLKERGADFDAVDINEQKPADLLPAGAQRDEL